MPTVLALDVSLSMSRPVKGEGTPEDFSRKNLAINGLSSFLDYLSGNLKLEFTSLVVFSYLWEQLVPFTRDVDAIKSALNVVGDYSKTCFEPVLNGLSSLAVDEWGASIPVQIIMVTDGNAGVGTGSLKHLLQVWSQTTEGEVTPKCPFPFPFKAKLHIVCIGNPSDPDVRRSLPLYQQLIDMNEHGGELFVPDSTSSLSMSCVTDMFSRLTDKYYSSYKGVLNCGTLKCNITLFPRPEPYNREDEYDSVHATVSDTLDICGFLDLQDIASPPTVSRHLVLPLPNKKKHSTNDSNGDGVKEEEDDSLDDGKAASFTVLLHGSLKVEGMVAVTRVAPDWYGILYSWADSKKKSSLMLSLFEPSGEGISWLGNLNYLSPISDFSESPYGDDDNRTPFPVRPKEKRSYAQSCVVWVKAIGLQADLQKVIRHARKLPDKQQQFYKELNRIRKAALSFGFTELLEAMASMLERECTMLPGSAHPDAALQLNHAATKLCSDMAIDASQSIMPLQTNFSQEDT